MINFANSYHKYVNRFLEINEAAKEAPAAVSYTHLTLPTT